MVVIPSVAAVPDRHRQGLSAWLALIHAWLPVLLAPALGAMVAAQAHRELSRPALLCFSAGALAVYTLDRLGDADGPDSASARLRPWRVPLVSIACAAGTFCALLLVVHRRTLGEAGCSLILLSLGYPLARTLPLGKTAAVALAWTIAAHHIASIGPWDALDAGLGLTIAASTIACDLKDEAHDRGRRVGSLPALLGGRSARLIASIALLTAMGVALAHQAAGLCVLALGQLLPLGLRMTARPVVCPMLVDALLVGIAGMAGLALKAGP